MWRFILFSLCFLLPVEQTGQLNKTSPAKTETPIQVCRDKIYSALGPNQLISPEGLHVAVSGKDFEAALARGFRLDVEALLKEAGDQQSQDQAILAKLTDEELTALHSDIAVCATKQSELLSRYDLVEYGIAMSEIAAAREYRHMGHLLVKSDEERVEKYNALVVKYNELAARCSH